uniref:Alpha-L-arabinofuranosidase 1 catalytic domain-containing protein n=1 Tax=Haptolina ericina TaxID=156174 RepID=A0A7S3BW04_9EUKA
MAVDESFEADGFRGGKWAQWVEPSTIVGNVSRTTGHAFHGVASTKLQITSGAGRVGVSNKGLGNAGLFLQANKSYEGYLFAQLGPEAPAGGMDIMISLEGALGHGSPLASTSVTLQLPGWTRLNFSLTPSTGTQCDTIQPADDPSVDCGNPISSIGHACVQCHGQFSVSISSVGSVYVDYVFLQPGSWARLGELPVLKSATEVLKVMGVTGIRQGGSYASRAPGSAAYYQWQDWTGPPWARPSRGAQWNECLIGGWGPFEMIAMCNALGIEPIITTTESSTPDSLADLVEYCWADPASSALGRQRANDRGTPAPYNVTYFELGNEQYNSLFVEQVEAMEKRATALGKRGELRYLFPSNNFLSDSDIAKAEKLSPRLDAQMLVDLHVLGGGGVTAAEALFAAHPDFAMGAANAETNAGTHTHQRAMLEAADLNEWMSINASTQARLHFRAASFCMGSANDFDRWDQGISFFLPNGTWLQPPGYVHQLIASTWQPFALPVEVTGGSTTSVSAQQAANGSVVVVRLVNDSPQPLNVSVVLLNATGVPLLLDGARLTAWSLQADDPDAANTAGAPSTVSPTELSLPLERHGTSVALKAFDYTVIEIQVS